VYQSSDILTINPNVDYSDSVKHWRVLMVAEAEAKMAASWLVTCSCGWE